MRRQSVMQKLSKTNKLEEFLKVKYDSIIMLGVRQGDITIMSTKDEIFTTAILDWATNECLLEVFPEMRSGYVH